MKNPILSLQNIKKQFDSLVVLKDINIDVYPGEFITLLGSSGCGKTTTLRIISGLEAPDSGRVILEGNDVTFSDPNKRNVNTVFQNYALFPHMSIEKNIAYSLKLKHIDKQSINKKVAETLALVQLDGFEKRMPNELSGGQKQRVAIARAIINEPKVLLLDEPLGALDLQLRRQMQIELKRLQKQLGITFIYITHDQEEALNMSDRIAVMKDGLFLQIGTPAEIYDTPKTAYVAKFVGSANIISGSVTSIKENTFSFECPCGTGNGTFSAVNASVGEIITMAVRSEQIILAEPCNPGLRGTVNEKSFAGGMLRISVILEDGTEIVASRHGINSELVPGDLVSVSWQTAHAVSVEPEDMV